MSTDGNDARGRRGPRARTVRSATVSGLAILLLAACLGGTRCAHSEPRRPGESDDERIARQAKRAVQSVAPDAAADVEIRVEDGVLYLVGPVPSFEVVERTLAEVAEIEGVRQVVNHLRVVDDERSPGGRDRPGPRMGSLPGEGRLCSRRSTGASRRP